MQMNLSQADIVNLTSFLSDSKRPDGTLCFRELQGFLFAVACSPELIPPSEWLPIISNEKDFGFQNEAEGQRTLEQIIGVSNSINIAVLERSKEMPQGCKFQAVLLVIDPAYLSDIGKNNSPDDAVEGLSLQNVKDYQGGCYALEIWDPCNNYHTSLVNEQ